MGQGFYSQCDNDSGLSFNGTDINDQCMYDTENLNSLPTGKTSFYIEMKASGSCAFDPSWLVEGFALPGTPANEYNFCLGLCSGLMSLSVNAPWQGQEVDFYGYRFYVWFVPNGFLPQITGVVTCGNQLCINWTVYPLPENGESDTEPKSAPFSLVSLEMPEDGSDYQGAPR